MSDITSRVEAYLWSDDRIRGRIELLKHVSNGAVLAALATAKEMRDEYEAERADMQAQLAEADAISEQRLQMLIRRDATVAKLEAQIAELEASCQSLAAALTIEEWGDIEEGGDDDAQE